jgi:hypothetical protein
MAYSSVFRRFKAPPTQEWTVDGWKGMYDARGTKIGPDEAPLLINLMPSDPERGGPVYLRPGRRSGTQLTGKNAAPRVGSGAHIVQLVMDVMQLASLGCLIVADGELWILDTGNALTKYISTANLTSASITLSPTTACSAVIHNGLVVITDGINTPFTWNGTNGGGLTKLTNAGTAVTAAAVYYAKLFFRKSDGKTLIWSEENQPNTGYEAGGFNNSWSLTQTASSDLTGLIGTNEALYYSRIDSVGAIRGAVTSTFSTDGVVDGVHLGSGSPERARPVNGHFVVCQGSLFWSDGNDILWAYRPGMGTIKLASQRPRINGTNAHANGIFNTPGVPVYGYGEETQHALPCNLLVADNVGRRLFVFFGNTSLPTWVEVYDAITYKLLSVWDLGTPNGNGGGGAALRFATVWYTSGFTFLVLIDRSGYVFTFDIDSPSATNTYDQDELGNATTVTGTLIGPMHGWGHKTDWAFTQLDVTVEHAGRDTITLGYLTSRTPIAGFTPPDQTLVYSGQSTATGALGFTWINPLEEHVRADILTTGRWCRPIVRITGNTATFTTQVNPPMISGYTLTGVRTGSNPGTLV